MKYARVHNEQMLEFIYAKQSKWSERPPDVVATFRKLSAYMIDKYVAAELANSSCMMRPEVDAIRENAIERLTKVDFRRLYRQRFADGTIAFEHPVDYRFVEAFLRHRQLEHGDPPKTFNRMLKHLTQFFDWIQLDPNPARAVLSVREGPRKNVTPLTEEEVADLLAAAADRSLKDLALIYVFLRFGCRSQEIRKLRPGDYDQERELIFLNPEARKMRQAHRLPVPPEIAKVLKDYLAHPTGPLWNNQSYLFPGENGYQMTHKELSRRLAELAAAANIRAFTAHTLRHTAFTLLSYVHNYDLYSIARIAGHSNVGITSRYIHIPLDVLRSVMESSSAVAQVEQVVDFPVEWRLLDDVKRNRGVDS